MSKTRERNPLGLYFWPLALSSFWIVEHHQPPPHLCGSGAIRSRRWGGVKPNLLSFRGLRCGRLQGGKPCKFSEIRPKSIHGQGHSRLVTMRPSPQWLFEDLTSRFYHAWLHSIPKQPCLEKHLYALVSQSPLLTDTEQWWKKWPGLCLLVKCLQSQGPGFNCGLLMQTWDLRAI